VNRRTFLTGLAACAGQLRAVGDSAAAELPFQLTDVTAAAGIAFRHNTGGYGGKLLPETLGAGCAFLDYDADG